MSERTDTERLDWLEAHGLEVEESQYVYTLKWLNNDGAIRWVQGNDLRKAIDTAMGATTEPEEARDE